MPGAGRTLIVVACRDEVGDTADAAWARRHGGDVLVVVPPPAEVSEIILRRVYELTPEVAVSEVNVARVVALCEVRCSRSSPREPATFSLGNDPKPS